MAGPCSSVFGAWGGGEEGDASRDPAGVPTAMLVPQCSSVGLFAPSALSSLRASPWGLCLQLAGLDFLHVAPDSKSIKSGLFNAWTPGSLNRTVSTFHWPGPDAVGSENGLRMSRESGSHRAQGDCGQPSLETS